MNYKKKDYKVNHSDTSLPKVIILISVIIKLTGLVIICGFKLGRLTLLPISS